MLCWVSLQEARRYQHLADYGITVPSYGLHTPQHVPIASYAIPDSASSWFAINSILDSSSPSAIESRGSSPSFLLAFGAQLCQLASPSTALHWCTVPCTGALCPALHQTLHCAEIKLPPSHGKYQVLESSCCLKLLLANSPSCSNH